MSDKAQPSAAEMRELLAHGPAVIYRCEPQEPYGTTFISPNIKAQMGYEPEDFIGDPNLWANFIHPEDAPRIFEGLSLLFDKDHHVHEYRFRHKDGAYRWVRDELRLVRDAAGNPKRIIGYWVDVSERKDVGEALRKSRHKLELRVQERTAQLTKTNKTLTEEIAERKQTERALRESEARFRDLTEGSIQGIIVQRDFKPLFVNRAFADIFGYDSPEEVLALDTLLVLMAPSEHARIDGSTKIRLAGKEAPSQYEYEGVRKDGSRIHVESRVRVVDWKGEPATQSTVFDVSGRKQAEEDLLKREYSLASAQRIAHLGSWGWNRKSGETWWSDEMFRILGREPGKIKPSSDAFYETVHADDRGMFKAALADALRRRTPFDIKHRIVRPSGEERWVHSLARVSFRGNFNPIYLGGTIQDITEHTQALEALRGSEDRVRLLLNSTGEGIYGVNLEEACVICNPACTRMLGFDDESELLGKQMHSLIHHTRPDGSEYPAEECRVHGAFRNGQTVHVDDEVFWRKDGTSFPVEYFTHPMRRDGKIIGAVVSFMDITERKESAGMLRQAQRMEAVGQLTGGVAHDFNNLLTVILGNLEMLEEGIEDDERLSKRAATARRAAQRGADLTHRLLAFSRRQALEPVAVRMNDRVTGMEDMLHRTLGETIELETVLAADLWPVCTDQGELENAVVNLAVNARDAMPEGGKLTIVSANTELDDGYTDLHPYVTAGPYVMLAVSDSGTGMPPEVIEKVFEPFFTTKEIGKGTGLGLSMVYGFIKQSGGHVTINSEEGRGTTVKLYFPRAESEVTATEDTVREDEVSAGTETILVVEDDPDVRDTAQQMLQSLGYAVLLAKNGPAALAMLEDGSDVDLVFTDVVMPGGMSGYDLATQIRERFGHMKVLCASGYAENALRRSGKAHTDISMLSKPYERNTLARRIRQALDD